ncbi:MAG: bifunctional tetrahydrofolate synthase/dihydrofolate synthase [Thioploca sp.]|nr:bifunctional tetrahydrofolate synthase/dihydrofolate synthase [Thioploca sp.]
MRFTTLDQWLDWQTSLHPREIELGLDRCRIVAQRLNLLPPPYFIITIAGTNGKGSSTVLLDTILSTAGYRVGRYTSPHLLRYNERICIAGQEVTDEQLCGAFNAIEIVRDNISLTFFEFSTLAAMLIFQANQIDLALLEVGLGGRLDAVNIFDADVALVTAIDIDHVDWLGPDRESIGLEKAGILRPYHPAVCSDTHPPQSLINYAHQLPTALYCLGQHFTYQQLDNTSWSWQYHSVIPDQPDNSFSYTQLPFPQLLGDFQLQNAAGVLMVLELIKGSFPCSLLALQQGLVQASLPGRFQILAGETMRILDVAHNPLGAQVLNKLLLHQQLSYGKTYAVVGMLKDKDIASVFKMMQNAIDHWYVAPLNTPRSATVPQLLDYLVALGITSIRHYPSITIAYNQACLTAQAGDRIVVFGSFYSVAEVLRLEQE